MSGATGRRRRRRRRRRSRRSEALVAARVVGTRASARVVHGRQASGRRPEWMPVPSSRWRPPRRREARTMTVYLINHLRVPQGGIPKPDNLLYLEQVERTFEPYGGRWLVLDAPVEVLEGAWPGSAVLMEFPDMATAKAWYHSPGYQEILHLRTDNVISDLVLVDPVAPGFTSAGWAKEVR